MNLIDKLKAIAGDNHVLTEDDARAAYETDFTGAYKSRVLAVVRPKDTAEIAAVMKLASETRTVVVPMGGNTGLSGGAYAGDDGSAIILSTERLTKIREINTSTRTAVVESGAVLETLHNAVDEHDLIFPLTFGARGSCRIGGVLATNAGGSNVLRYGNTRALCLGLEAVTPEGEVLDLMSSLRKDNTGFDLRDLLIGSEGALAVITAAVLKLFPKPAGYGTATIAVPDFDAALGLLNELNDVSNGSVEAFEYMSKEHFQQMTVARPDLTAAIETLDHLTIMLEIGLVGGDSQQATEMLEDVLGKAFEEGRVLDAAIAQNEAQRQSMWACREAGLEIVQPRPPVILTDIALPLDKIGTYLEIMEKRLPVVAPGAMSVVVGHLGDGNLHYTIWPDPDGKGLNEDRHIAISEEAEAVALDLGGSFSAEHGVGVYKLHAMRRFKNPVALDAMRRIKAAWDPNNILNPGKLVPED